MRRILIALFLGAVAILGGLAFAQAVALPETSDGYYRYTNSRRPEATGYFHVSRRASGDKTAPVLLENEFMIRYRGKTLGVRMQTWCLADEFLSPVKIASKGHGSDEFGTFTATITRAVGALAGKLSATVKGRDVQIEIPERTVTDFALFEVVRTLPFDKEKTFEFNTMEASELQVKKGSALVYLGKEEVLVDGETLILHKFAHPGEGVRGDRYWLNDKHELIRILMDGDKELLLTTKDKALATVEPPKNE